MTALDVGPGAVRRGGWWRAALVRGAILTVLWWILAEGSLRGWVVAGVSIVAALLASLALLPPRQWRLRPLGAARFIPFFVWQSFRGGVDVAHRALRPRLPIQPGFLHYPLRLPPGPGRTFFVAVLGLFPGTLSVELRDRQVRVHTLDQGLSPEATLRLLEDRIADAFGIPLRAEAEHTPANTTTGR